LADTERAQVNTERVQVDTERAQVVVLEREAQGAGRDSRTFVMMDSDGEEFEEEARDVPAPTPVIKEQDSEADELAEIRRMRNTEREERARCVDQCLPRALRAPPPPLAHCFLPGSHHASLLMSS
jgi:hypothetical protein